jgi:hypothetical protein
VSTLLTVEECTSLLIELRDVFNQCSQSTEELLDTTVAPRFLASPIFQGMVDTLRSLASGSANAIAPSAAVSPPTATRQLGSGGSNDQGVPLGLSPSALPMRRILRHHHHHHHHHHDGSTRSSHYRVGEVIDEEDDEKLAAIAAGHEEVGSLLSPPSITGNGDQHQNAAASMSPNHGLAPLVFGSGGGPSGFGGPLSSSSPPPQIGLQSNGGRMLTGSSVDHHRHHHTGSIGGPVSILSGQQVAPASMLSAFGSQSATTSGLYVL